MRRAKVIAALAGCAITALSLAPATASASTRPASTAHRHQACATARAGSVRCLSVWRGTAKTGRTAQSAAVAKPAEGLGPADIKSAYGLPSSGGAGQTIAIVDAYDNPHAESDLKAYRSAFGLSPCTTANGCFRKVNQRGGTAYPEGDAGWGVEIALDVQAVSAACPSCKILLVEADDSSLESIGIAENRAVTLGAKVVSNSYGTDEFNGIIQYGKRYYTHPGVPIVASSGDYGFTAAAFPAVLKSTWAVGGTTLTKTGSGWTEKAWEGAGSGCSAWIGKPAWQKDNHCQMRVTSDVSAVADPDTGFAVYDTYGLDADNGWLVVGGTSLSAPLISGMIGLAHNSTQVASPAYLYNHRAGLKDVVGGSNGYCGGDYLCTAVKGYDGPTGLGSPRGLSAL